MTTQTFQDAQVIKIGRLILGKLGGPSLLLVLAWPWILFALNHDWLFLNSTFVDSWIYFGFFQNLREYQNIYASANIAHQAFYYDDRLTWILPGYLAYRIFPPLIANYVLHFGIYYTAILSLYATLTITIHRRVALLTSLLMGSYSYFLIAVGWDYIDGAGLAYFSLTLLVLSLAAKRPYRLFWLGLAGALAAALIFSNLFWITLTPCFALYYILLNRRRSIKLILPDLLALIAGALSLTAIMGLINIAFGGSPFFFSSSLEFTSYANSLPTNLWVSSISNWPISQPYLIWPFIMMLASGLWLAFVRLRRRFDTYPQSRTFLALFLLASVILVAINMRGSSPVLLVFYYASYLIPALFLAIGAIQAPLITGLSRTRFAGLISVSALTSVFSFTFRACGELPIKYPAVLAITLGLIWLGTLIRFPHRAWSYSLFILAFCVATPSAFEGFSRQYATNTFCSMAPRTQPQPEDTYLAVLDGIQTIRETVPEKRVYFWFNEHEQPIYSALSSAYLYNWNQISRDFPAIPSPDVSSPNLLPPPGTTIVVLSRTATALANAEATLRQRYRTFHLIAQKIIHRGEIEFTLFIGEIQAIPQKILANQVIDFTRVGYTDRFLGHGWSKPGETGTWTEGSQAELDMIIDRPAHQDIEMIVDVASSIGAFVAHPPDIVVQALVNGIRLDTWNFTAQRPGGEFHVVIPDAVLSISDTTHIVLNINQPHTPRDLGINDDVRALGIIIRSIRFTNHNP